MDGDAADGQKGGKGQSTAIGRRRLQRSVPEAHLQAGREDLPVHGTGRVRLWRRTDSATMSSSSAVGIADVSATARARHSEPSKNIAAIQDCLVAHKNRELFFNLDLSLDPSAVPAGQIPVVTSSCTIRTRTRQRQVHRPISRSPDRPLRRGDRPGGTNRLIPAFRARCHFQRGVS